MQFSSLKDVFCTLAIVGWTIIPPIVFLFLQVRDAKCLHAHVADALMRGRGANAIGRATLDLLESRGVNTSGGDRCFEQCDYTAEETKDSWRCVLW